MDTILKPMMKLLPKRKTAGGSKGAKGGEEAKEPPPNLHHLLYAMKNLNPKFIAVATEVSIVPWSMGSEERPEIDAFLTVMREAELERKHTKTKKKHKKKGDGSDDDDDDEESDEGEAHPHGAERSKSKSSADGVHHGGAAATDAAATKGKDDDDKNKKKKKKSLPSYGCCLTDKGTLTFISPDGLAMLEASINRRNMRLIEVKKARHCVDAEVDGVKVSIVWSFIDNSAQTGDKAKSKFREVASEVLPDVEYVEIFSSDDEDDDEESDKRSVEPQSDKGDDSMVHDPTDGAPAPAVDDGKRRSTRPLPETAHYEPISDDEIPSPPPEYEQLQGEPDEAPFDLTPAVRRLERARLATMQLTARKKAAQKWLAAYEAQQQEELLKQSTAANNNSLTSADDATLEVDAVHVSDRETVLRLALLIAVICDKQRTLTSALTVKLPPTSPSSMGHF